MKYAKLITIVNKQVNIYQNKEPFKTYKEKNLLNQDIFTVLEGREVPQFAKV